MTLREQELILPEMVVVVGSVADAASLAPLRHVDDAVRTTLVATGPDPMAVDEALDDLGAPAGRILLSDASARGPAHELADLLPRLDDTVAGIDVAAVVVRGGSAAAMAGAQVAVWRRLPLIALPAPAEGRADAANQAAIGELAAWQTSAAGGTPFPAWLDLLVHRRVADAGGAHVFGVATTRGLSA